MPDPVKKLPDGTMTWEHTNKNDSGSDNLAWDVDVGAGGVRTTLDLEEPGGAPLLVLRPPDEDGFCEFLGTELNEKTGAEACYHRGRLGFFVNKNVTEYGPRDDTRDFYDPTR